MRIKLYNWILGMGSVLTLAACSGGTPPQGASAPQSGATNSAQSNPAPQARCDAKAAQSLVGQPFDNDTLARVRAATGALEARMLRPDSMITKEFKFSRVNVVVDANERIVRVHCG